MQTTDMQDNALTGASASSALAYSSALEQLSNYAGDPLGIANSLIKSDPGFVMAHVFKAWLFLLGTDAKAVAPARAIVARAASLAASPRERGHISALNALTEGKFHVAAQIMEDVNADHPRDLLGLIAGHQLDFFTGNSRMLRDRISRAMPYWSKDVPGYHAMLSMHAFGLEEMGEYGRAEDKARQALDLQRFNGWARHAVAHVMEMQGRHEEGIRFMRDDIESWTQGSFFSVHNWWHLALYHLEIGDHAEVLKLADGPILNAEDGSMIDLIDASALLWRLNLRGIDAGNRWAELAKRYEAKWVPGYYAFNDLHAVMAFLGAGRKDLIEATLAAQEKVQSDNVLFAGDVGLPLMQGFIAFHQGNHARALNLMRPVRNIASRFGGSHAQRDIIDLTMLEAALRSGDVARARGLAAERAHAKHDSPLAALFAKRSGLHQVQLKAA
ncbi:MAG: tetratricopeptide repeat protein [Hyphomicrobiales bacterium]